MEFERALALVRAGGQRVGGIGILGENGSGKSTLFSILTGLQKGKGAFFCDGVNIKL